LKASKQEKVKEGERQGETIEAESKESKGKGKLFVCVKATLRAYLSYEILLIN